MSVGQNHIADEVERGEICALVAAGRSLSARPIASAAIAGDLLQSAPAAAK